MVVVSLVVAYRFQIGDRQSSSLPLLQDVFSFIQWMDKILHYFEAMRTLLACRETIIPGCLRYCRISSIHSSFALPHA